MEVPNLKRMTCFILVITCLLYTKCYAVEDTEWKIFDDSECQYDYLAKWYKAVFTSDSGKVYVRFRDAVSLMLYSCDENNNLTDIRSMNDDFFVEREYEYSGTKIPYSFGALRHEWGLHRGIPCYPLWAPISTEIDWCIDDMGSPIVVKYPMNGEKMDYIITGNSPKDIISQIIEKEPFPDFANDPEVIQTERYEYNVEMYIRQLKLCGMYYYSFYDIKTNCIYLVYDVPAKLQNTYINRYYSCMYGVSLTDGTVTKYSTEDKSWNPRVTALLGYPYSDGNEHFNNGLIPKGTVLTCKLNNKAYAFNDAIAIYTDSGKFDSVYVPFDRLCEVLGYSYSEDRSNKIIHIKYMYPENDPQGLIDRKYKPFKDGYASTLLWRLLKQRHQNVTDSDLFDTITRNRFHIYDMVDYLDNLKAQ